MSLKRDSVTAWTKSNGAAIASHRGQPLPKTSGGAFGSSVFGFASRTLGITLPGPLGMVSPTGLFDRDALVKAGTTWGLSKLGNMLNGALNSSNRSWLENQDHNNLLGMTTGYRHDHKIEDRGYLSFMFPPEAYAGIITPDDNFSIGGESFKAFTLPFFENPKISESRSAEYASHKIVNRNEPYRLWTGAKPTKVSLSFNITLPHLMTFAHHHIDKACGEILNTNDFKQFILGKLSENVENEVSMDVDSFMDSIYAATPQNLQQAVTSGQKSDDFYDLTNKILKDMGHPKGLGNTDSHRSRLILYCTYLINLIRSSVIGSSNATASEKKGSSQGNAIEAAVRKYLPAPVIFLTYGSMYNNTPFIATNYSITFDGKNGYEELSLLPRVIQVKLTLESYNQFKNSDKVIGVPKLFSSEAYVNDDFGDGTQPVFDQPVRVHNSDLKAGLDIDF